MELNLKECYYPSNLAPLDIRGIMRNPYDGEIIYISLLKFIIEKLLKKQQKSIKEQEITIIQENNSEILYYFLEELAPVVKFLNVVTYEREKVEKFLESICEETGLSVRVTNDFSSDVRSVDILINIGDLAKIRNGNNIPASTIIVNYGKLEEKFLRNNFVINDLKIRMDEDIDKAVKIAEEKFRDIEIADLVINRLLVSQSKDLSFRHKMELTSKKFVEKGWSISKLNSHHINVKNSE